jgi:hypothetical protein
MRTKQPAPIQTPEARKFASAVKRIKKIQSEIESGETRPSELLLSLTRAFDNAYRMVRFLGQAEDEAVTVLATRTAAVVETGERLHKLKLQARADFAGGQAELQRERIDPESWQGELKLGRIWGAK